jgi:hypothetical protein
MPRQQHSEPGKASKSTLILLSACIRQRDLQGGDTEIALPSLGLRMKQIASGSKKEKARQFACSVFLRGVHFVEYSEVGINLFMLNRGLESYMCE